MHVKILGSAAGGGFPQWNCACPNCRLLREGTFPGKARAQLQVAISSDRQSWILLNASPDLRSQINQDSDLHPRAAKRGTPITSVFLTSAELDQVLGLLSLREFQSFRVYATRSVQKILREDNSVFRTLNRVGSQVSWVDIEPNQKLTVTNPSAEREPFQLEFIALSSHFPTYVSPERSSQLCARESLLGIVVASASGARLAYFPSVPAIDAALLKHLTSADVILMDGTFWADDELIQVRGEGPTARQIGHVPISGDDGTLKRLKALRATRKIFVHINNTNPVLNESTQQFRQICEAGWELAEDGWELTL
jgi:pyrroloquinoline quinone biosynthesis protein B